MASPDLPALISKGPGVALTTSTEAILLPSTVGEAAGSAWLVVVFEQPGSIDNNNSKLLKAISDSVMYKQLRKLFGQIPRLSFDNGNIKFEV